MTIAAPTSRAIPAIADDVPEFRRSVCAEHGSSAAVSRSAPLVC